MLRGLIRPKQVSAAVQGGRRFAHASAEAHCQLMRFTDAFRQRGHMQAELDPLGLNNQKFDDPHLSLSKFRLDRVAEAELFNVEGIVNMGKSQATLPEIVEHLKRSYSGPIAAQFAHCETPEEREFLATRLEQIVLQSLSKEEQVRIHHLLHKMEVFDHFLAKKFTSLKRYGGEGVDSMLPMFDSLFQQFSQQGVDDVVIAMPHRGRLNLLVQLMQYPARTMFHKIKGNSEFPPEIQYGSTGGDVLSHLGISTDLDYNQQKKLHVSLLQNPSHLEAGNPQAMGKARAKIADGRNAVAVQVHGDAAFAGQGTVAECFTLANVPHFTVGGSMHLIINNQVGFTTTAQNNRSSRYSSDVAKMVSAPTLLVNADRPEQVIHATRLAADYRNQFKKDIVLELIGYRRHGHNELDEPRFTQPKMYSLIRDRPSIAKMYSEQLQVDADAVKQMREQEDAALEAEFKQATASHVPKADHLEGPKWGNGAARQAREYECNTQVDTGVDVAVLKDIGMASVTLPADFKVHDRLARFHNAARVKALDSGVDGKTIDWATAEALAAGSLLSEGFNLRLSGQDVTRGTFSHRHWSYYDQTTGAQYTPLSLTKGGRLEVVPSPLSELAVLGFEYGYSTESPRNFAIWEAQFGDFSNTAQMIIDQFIASGEEKWLKQSSLTMLLPHGMDGAGPEHSSCRVERYLQLCDGNIDGESETRWANMHVVNPTTPANYFHVLRRQMHREYRKPLIVVGPKTVIRLPAAVSSLAEMAPGTRFQPVLGDASIASASTVNKVIMCSGKIYYDLVKERTAKNLSEQVAIVRVEELSPFPYQQLAAELNKYSNASTFVWCQEEQQNQGAYPFVNNRIRYTLSNIMNKQAAEFKYAGRAASGLTATGIGAVHKKEVEAIFSSVFA